MNEQELKNRTKKLALSVISVAATLPQSRIGDVLGRQLLRSGTAVGANYRAACKSRSDSEMVAKLGIVEEEADESQYWLESLADSGLVDSQTTESLHREFGEILAIMIASRKTLKTRIQRHGNVGR